MDREKAYVTDDNKLRVPSLTGESLHEYNATDKGIMYRRIKLDGSPEKGRFGLWKPLSRNDVLKQMITCAWQPEAGRWFAEHGITIEKLRADREAELKRKLRDVRRRR